MSKKSFRRKHGTVKAVFVEIINKAAAKLCFISGKLHGIKLMKKMLLQSLPVIFLIFKNLLIFI